MHIDSNVHLADPLREVVSMRIEVDWSKSAYIHDTSGQMFFVNVPECSGRWLECEGKA